LQIELAGQNAPVRRPHQQNTRCLSPTHLVAGRSDIVMRVELNDLLFHRGQLPASMLSTSGRT
jgi:hypothetical protein